MDSNNKTLKKLINYWAIFNFIILASCFLIADTSDIYISAIFINILSIILLYTIIRYSINRASFFYSKNKIIYISIIASLFFLILYKCFYYFQSDGFFELNAVDSLKYHDWAIEMNEYGFFNGIYNYINNYGTDGLGAVFFTSIAYKIYPSTIVFNVFKTS